MPVHGTRMILMSDGYCNLIEPARSAAVYPQKLQQNAMMIGSKSSFIIPPWIDNFRLMIETTPLNRQSSIENCDEYKQGSQTVHIFVLT